MSNTHAVNLAACPFCNSCNLEAGLIGSRGFFGVWCKECEAFVIHEKLEGALMRWNRRLGAGAKTAPHCPRCYSVAVLMLTRPARRKCPSDKCGWASK